ncbi:MAG: hypothetical protein WC670_12730 [Pseudolabrys sp.]
MTIASLATVSTAEAKPKHRHHAQAQSQARVTCDHRGCSDNPTAVAAGQATQRARGGRRARLARANNDATVTATGQTQTAAAGRRRAVADANGNGIIIGSRPSGCPSRFCGCEASLYVFGTIRKDLNLAANWVRKFPRTQPASGMVAARSGHVFVLMRQVDGNQWLVHDGNSGGGRTREHVRSIAGYAIVDPHASRYAAN